MPPPLPVSHGSECQGCHALAPTRQVLFIRHVGAIVLGFSQHTRGRFCRNCVNLHFARNTLVTSLLGWWGIKSFVFTPVFLLNNIAHFLLSLPLKPAQNGTYTGGGLAFTALFVATTFLTALAVLLKLTIFR